MTKDDEQQVDVTDVPKVPAPHLPPEGAMTAQPLTGAGPHRAPVAEKEKEKKRDNRPPAVPNTAATKKPQPKQPHQPQQPRVAPDPRPAQEHVQQQVPQATYGMSPVGNSAMLSLMSQVLDSTRSANQSFYLVVVPEDDWPRIETFAEVGQLCNRIKELLGTHCHLFPFLGNSLTITDGDHRFLNTPFGSLPLFDIPAPNNTQTAEHGWVGPPIKRTEIPTGHTEDEDGLPPVSEEDEEDQEPEKTITEAEDDPVV